MEQKNGSVILVVIVVVMVVAAISGGAYYYVKNKASTREDTGTVLVGEKVTKPNDFPKNIPIYPNMTYNSFANSVETGTGYSGITQDSPATVLAWFKPELTKNNWKLEAETADLLSISAPDTVGSISVDDNGKGGFLLAFSTVSSANADYELTKAQQEMLKQTLGQ